jgi:hypothetical protein
MHVYRCVAYQRVFFGADRTENTVFLLLRFVYGAVAQQRVRQIHYIAPSLRLFVPNSLTAHPHSFLSGGLCFQRL